MKALKVKGLAKFEKLNNELRAAEAMSFGTRLPRGMERHRKSLVQAIARDRTNNILIGQLVAGYRDHYKIDQTWMPIGESIAHALGYKSYTSLNSLIKAAQRASQVPEVLLAAIIESGIDPTENKYRKLVNELRNMTFTGTSEDACVVAQAAIDRFLASKKAAAARSRVANSHSATQIGERFARQVSMNLRNLPFGERKRQTETILREIEHAIGTETPGWSISITWVKSASTSQIDNAHRGTHSSHASSIRGELLTIPSPTSSPAIPDVPRAVRAAVVDAPSPRSHDINRQRKHAVRSIEDNQLGLFDEEIALG